MRSAIDRVLSEEGRVWFRNALAEPELAALDSACATGSAPGRRLGISGIRMLLASVDRLAEKVLPGARPVRLVAFNKNESANWSLPWHQDRVIAVRERHDLAEYENWTRKTHVWHVEPPVDLLERMIFARVHLDAATSRNGCMEIALGSHLVGRVADTDAQRFAVELGEPELCLAERGDVLFVKALTLHRSRASQDMADRRAIRIDYAAEPLPPPLEWEIS